MAKNDFSFDEMPDYESDNQTASYGADAMPNYADDSQEWRPTKQEEQPRPKKLASKLNSLTQGGMSAARVDRRLGSS